jgi:hypothetical protein
MMRLEALINFQRLEGLKIVNTMQIFDGEHLYTVAVVDESFEEKNIGTILHKREDGWMRLAIKALELCIKEGGE